MREGEAVDRKLAELRQMYEPFLCALSRFFLLAVPPIVPESLPVDNWQTSAWMRADQRDRQSRTGGPGRRSSGLSDKTACF